MCARIDLAIVARIVSGFPAATTNEEPNKSQKLNGITQFTHACTIYGYGTGGTSRKKRGVGSEAAVLDTAYASTLKTVCI